MAVIWTRKNPFDNWNPEEQCFGQYATDEVGLPVRPTAATACRWCAKGQMERMKIPYNVQNGFNRWLLDHFEAQTITILNDTNGWKPIDFAFAWDKFVIDLDARPTYYLHD